MFWTTSLFLLIAFHCETILAPCPFGTLHYRSADKETSKCYIVLKFWELRHIRIDLWNEYKDSLICKDADEYNCEGVIDSYPDALRVCAMVPRMTSNYSLGNRGTVRFFNYDWATIPGPDVKLSLPTPNTTEHIRWLMDNVLIDFYNTYYDYKHDPKQDRGKLWLDIKKASHGSHLKTPVKPDAYLTQKGGECGYLFRGDSSTTTNRGYYAESDYNSDIFWTTNAEISGLYWVSCADDHLEDKANTDGYAGRHMVACEFDEPKDCVQELDRDECIYSEVHRFCMLTGTMKVIVEPHPRFGKECPDLITAQDIPCQKKHWDQCAVGCHYEYTDETPCFVKEGNQTYKCTEKDVNGTMYQKLVVKRGPMFGGDPCPTAMRREVECLCHATKIQAYGLVFCLGLKLLMVFIM